MSIENIIITHSDWRESDLKILFEDEPVHYSQAQGLPELLVEVGVYASRSDARRAGREGMIPVGWTELKASKKRRLWIWNPRG